MKKTRFADLVVGVLFIVLGIAVYIGASRLQTVKLGIGPGGFPRFISVFMEILGVCMTVSVLKDGMPRPEFKIEAKSLIPLLASIALCIVYVSVVSTVGFVLCTPVLLFAMMLLFGSRKYLQCIIISIVTTAVIWLLFTKVFMIFLPACRLFQ